MPLVSRSVHIAAPAAEVFAYVDDIRNVARHMSESRSMPMMGSRLNLEISSPQPTGIGATYRYTGQVMGFRIDFSETVVRYQPGREKTWRTVGEPRLPIIASYEMAVRVEPSTGESCLLAIDFNYELPRTGPWRLIGKALAPLYARWCIDSMLTGTKTDMETAAH